jgi:hypothetical protein
MNPPRLLAEAPQFTAADVALIILSLLGMLLLAGGVAVLGFVLAGKAAAGSPRALAGWIAVVAVEAVFGAILVVSGGWMVAAVIAVVIAVQVGLFVSQRNGSPPRDQ